MFVKINYIPQLIIATGLIFFSVSISLARADDDDGGVRIVTNAKWKEECGGCHLAYPPRFLSAQSWRAVMLGLDKHFGSDASLDEADIKEVMAFLEANADQRKRPTNGNPILRISEMRWFKSEHDEISARTWKNPKVKSPANCGACHTQVELGDFSEDNVVIPR